jgi:fructosamine-3-kinase
MHAETSESQELKRRALRLEYLTIGWNLGEAVLTIGLGIAAASLALVGFGTDSIIEVFASVVVVWHLAPGQRVDNPERTARALRLVAGAFLTLSVVLAVVATRDLVTQREPGESIWGIVYLGVTVLVMLGLALLKQRTGRALGSAPLLSEARMTFLDAILAGATLLGLAANAALGWWWADPAAALAVAVAAFGEARQNWIEAGENRPEAANGPLIDLDPDLELSEAEAEQLLEAWLPGPVACSGVHRLKGGMVNSVFRLEFDRPPYEAVVKVHRPDTDTFAIEAQALEHLGTKTACPVPRVYLHDGSARNVPNAFLLMEKVPGVCLDGLDLDPADRADIDRQLAEVLSDLHGHTASTWGRVGTSEQSSAWADLFANRLAEVRAQPLVAERLTPAVLASVDDAIAMARPALGDSGPPTLVHGDVWAGNLMVERRNGRWRLTGLLDPDLQFADVELELAYLEVFDTPRDAFFAAYTQHRTLRPGYEQRRLFYWLHTALLHVALFGDDFFREFTARTADKIGRIRQA